MNKYCIFIHFLLFLKKIINAMEYNKVLIQKEGGSDADTATVKDTVADFGVWCQDMPFNVGMEVKEPTVRDWKDEDGEDAYVGGGLRFSAYDMTVKWIAKGLKGSVRGRISTFLRYLSGQDGSGVKMKLWCEWTGIGRQHVRLKKVEDNATLDRCGDDEIVTFSTVFRVEDPVTDIQL